MAVDPVIEPANHQNVIDPERHRDPEQDRTGDHGLLLQ
jgi:hypothetical protein